MLNNNKKQETQFFGTKCGNANSIAAGYATETTNYGEIATGILNKSTKGDNPNSPEGVVGDPKATLFSVGCGTKEERKNALEVKGDGSVIISGKDGSDVNINEEIKYLKDRSVVSDTEGRVLIPYTNSVKPIFIRRTNAGDYMYIAINDVLDNNIVPQYIYDETTNEVIKVTENKNSIDEINSGDFFNTEEPLNLSHELYLDNEKTGNISYLEKLTIKESDVFEGLPYVCEEDTLNDDEAPQYIYDAIDKKWITVNESYYLSSFDFFNTEKPLDLSHTLFYRDGENITDYDRTAGRCSIALGYKAKATGTSAIALGDNAKATSDRDTALGSDAKATNYFSTALGSYAQATKSYSTALGGSSQATDTYSIALGYRTQATKENATALGSDAQATGKGAIALGYNAQARGYSSATALGIDAQSTGNLSNALGYNAQATGYSTIALGSYAKATNSYSIALGFGVTATGDTATALGHQAKASGMYSIALGDNAQAAQPRAIALGMEAKATGNGAIALGIGADVSKNYAIAIGKNSKNNKSIFSVGFNGVNGIDMDEDNYGLYLKGFGGYTGKNLTVTNGNVETLNPNIKSVQEIINSKVDLTPIVTSTDATISLQPNKKYEITAGDTLVLTFTEPSDKTHKNEYSFSINTGNSVSTITFPIEIIWDVEPVIAANKHYEINVQYSQGKYWGTARTWNIPS